jgi:hypothetical protein
MDRWNPGDARAVIERLIPAEDARENWLTLLADAIETADRVHPCSWGVTLFPRKLRLNVGTIETVVFSPGGAMLVLDGGRFTDEEIHTIRENPHLGSVNAYRSVPGTVRLNVAYDSTSTMLADARTKLLPLVERAASRVKTGTVYFRSHSPGVVMYVIDVTGIDLKQPGYGRRAEGLICG